MSCQRSCGREPRRALAWLCRKVCAASESRERDSGMSANGSRIAPVCFSVLRRAKRGCDSVSGGLLAGLTFAVTTRLPEAGNDSGVPVC